MAKQRDVLESLRIGGVRFERDEKWKKAARIYDKALAIDKNAGFAIGGKKRAVKYSRLNDQIERYLKQPDRLQSYEPLARARKLVLAVQAASHAGPLLKNKGDKLRILIDRVSAPLPVLLKSDGKTDVTVYRVGRFGTFTERRVMLRPGAYTAVGSRSGYRDARVQFRVPMSGQTPVITIRCRERI